MVAHGCDSCVAEISSHALHQRRAAGLSVAGAIFTNLTGDHLDYHGTMEDYACAKAMLFEMLPSAPRGWAVVNSDDPAAARMVRRCAARVISCSIAGRGATCQADICREGIDGCEVTLSGPWGSFGILLPLIGRHNVINSLQAAAACYELGVGRAVLREGLRSVTAPPGRLERVAGAGELTVLVDYAHTDDALQNVLRALRPLVPQGAKLRVVFGCGGDRDRSKRPRMAAAVCQWADDVIVTSDNPRTEDPQAIIDQVLEGVPAERRPHVAAVVNRSEAIERAIESSVAGDVVLIAGKGHEDYQIIGTVKHPFDDRLVAADALRGRHLEAGAR
jgi:UDP-N-acetylmuramoyl-L-alanyl-D-glutamate--2,6-diaminopimelate ligase